MANFLSTTFYDLKVTFGCIGESPEHLWQNIHRKYLESFLRYLNTKRLISPEREGFWGSNFDRFLLGLYMIYLLCKLKIWPKCGYVPLNHLSFITFLKVRKFAEVMLSITINRLRGINIGIKFLPASTPNSNITINVLIYKK